MDAGQAFSRIKDAVLYVYDALADFVFSIDPDFIFTTLMPFLNWVVLGAAALILLEACVRYLLDASETVLVLLLYTLGLPVMLLGLLRRGQNAPAGSLLAHRRRTATRSAGRPGPHPFSAPKLEGAGTARRGYNPPLALACRAGRHRPV
jgi:hypothetical protein